jgi:hypothetical protein
MLKVRINGLAGFQSAGELLGLQLPSLPGPVMAWMLLVPALRMAGVRPRWR